MSFLTITKAELRSLIRESLSETSEQSEDAGRYHISPRPLTRADLKPVPPSVQKEVELMMKPKGFWYSCGSSWEDWVSREMPDRVHPYKYALDIDTSRMLIIDTHTKFQDFQHTYARSSSGRMSMLYPQHIDWHAVTQDYAGIEICPYMWKFRMDSVGNWYYGWDVASGVIWDTSIIRDITPVNSDD